MTTEKTGKINRIKSRPTADKNEPKKDRTLSSKYKSWKSRQDRSSRIMFMVFFIINIVAFTSGYWWAVILMLAIDAAIIWKVYGKRIKEYRAKQKALKIEKAKDFLKKEGVKKL